MMATWEDLDKEQEGVESQEKEVVATLYFIADIISNEKIEVIYSERKLSYDDLQKAYDQLLDDS